MILYVDETENSQYFVVVGLLLENEDKAKKIYKIFKKSIKNYRISKKDKTKIYTEFKSYILDSHFQKIKIKLLETISSYDNSTVYYSYIIKKTNIKQSQKEKIYIRLLNKIVTSIDKNINIIFDSFNNIEFERNIISYFSKKKNVLTIKPLDSQITCGLQLVDNICSVVRLKISNMDNNGFYNIIKKLIKKL